MLYLYRGSTNPAFPFGSQVLDFAAPEPFDPGHTHDHLGWALAAGDVNQDGSIDFFVGAPARKIGSAVHAGKVYVIFGGPWSGGHPIIKLAEQDPSMPAQADSEFGISVTGVRAFDPATGQYHFHVIAGASGAMINNKAGAGRVTVHKF